MADGGGPAVRRRPSASAAALLASAFVVATCGLGLRAARRHAGQLSARRQRHPILDRHRHLSVRDGRRQLVLALRRAATSCAVRPHRVADRAWSAAARPPCCSCCSPVIEHFRVAALRPGAGDRRPGRARDPAADAHPQRPASSSATWSRRCSPSTMSARSSPRCCSRSAGAASRADPHRLPVRPRQCRGGARLAACALAAKRELQGRAGRRDPRPALLLVAGFVASRAARSAGPRPQSIAEPVIYAESTPYQRIVLTAARRRPRGSTSTATCSSRRATNIATTRRWSIPRSAASPAPRRCAGPRRRRRSGGARGAPLPGRRAASPWSISIRR